MTRDQFKAMIAGLLADEEHRRYYGCTADEWEAYMEAGIDHDAEARYYREEIYPETWTRVHEV